MKNQTKAISKKAKVKSKAELKKLVGGAVATCDMNGPPKTH